MSTSTAPPPLGTLDLSKSVQTPFIRLVRVEWRKMIDTRSGAWLIGITGGLLLLAMALVVLIVGINDESVSAQDMSQVFVIPVSLLVPVFAILIVTSEWSQRTALTSFTLEPHRVRVIGAKLVAVSATAVGTIVVAMIVGALTNVLCAVVTGNDLRWELQGEELFWMVIGQLAFFAMGFALACLILNTPGAIALFYVIAMLLPLMVWGTLFALFDWAKDILPWVDINTALSPLMSGRNIIGDPVEVEAVNYVQALWTIFLWVGIPITVGLRRILRAEVK